MAEQTCPLSALGVLDSAFLENRARLLEVAAFLDRVDRAGSPDVARGDYRYRALLAALELLVSCRERRAEALHLAFSDPTPEPRASASGLAGAAGAWDGSGP